jgi:hypothetical protein
MNSKPPIYPSLISREHQFAFPRKTLYLTKADVPQPLPVAEAVDLPEKVPGFRARSALFASTQVSVIDD